jgi:hypothetical protein
MRSTTLALCLALATFAVGAQTARTFEARLTPLPLDVQNRTQITGGGSGSAVLDSGRLRVNGTFAGLKAPATVAHLHVGSALGIRGEPVLELDVDRAVEGGFSGEWELSADQLRALDDGRMYIQIDSEIAPEGNLWGWLLP